MREGRERGERSGERGVRGGGARRGRRKSVRQGAAGEERVSERRVEDGRSRKRLAEVGQGEVRGLGKVVDRRQPHKYLNIWRMSMLKHRSRSCETKKESVSTIKACVMTR